MKKYMAIAVILIVVCSGFGYYYLYIEKEQNMKEYFTIKDLDSSMLTLFNTTELSEVSPEIVSTLQAMALNGSRKWIGGIVESCNQKWGFRFKLDTIAIADNTAEGLQASIEYISTHLDYWNGTYGYVSSIVLT
jgi:hypothetical protein